MTHIQIHRSSVGGATPNTETMLEGEIAVNLTDKKLFVKGATGELITLAAPQTHADTDHVTSFNGETGVVTFNDYVTTFNGSTGAIDTTSLILPITGISGAAGITFSDGTFQKSAARNGFRYEASSFMTGTGKITIQIDQSSTEFDSIQVATTDADGNNLQTLYQELQNNGGFISVIKGDSSYILATTVRSDPTYDGSFSIGEEEQSVIISGGGFNYYQLQTNF